MNPGSLLTGSCFIWRPYIPCPCADGPTFRVLGFEGEMTAVGSCAKHLLPSWWNCLGSPWRLQKVAHLEKVGCYRQVLKDELDPKPLHSLLPDAMRWIAFSMTTYSRLHDILRKQGWTIMEQTLWNYEAKQIPPLRCQSQAHCQAMRTVNVEDM